MNRITALSVLPTLTLITCAALSDPATAQSGIETCQLPTSPTIDSTASTCGLPAVGRRSLTVVGQGRVTAMADSALMEFSIGGNESSGSESTASSSSAQPTSQTPEAALKPTINALTAADVPASNITIQTNLSQNLKLVVKLDKPTQLQMQQVALTVNRSLKSNQQLVLQGISAGYAVNNCQPLERTARRIALQDAQSQMTSLAQDVKVGLGELLSVVVTPFIGSRTALSCGSKIAAPASPFSLVSEESLPPYNPSDKPEVQLTSQVSVTHAIKSRDRP